VSKVRSIRLRKQLVECILCGDVSINSTPGICEECDSPEIGEHGHAHRFDGKYHSFCLACEVEADRVMA
jgi:hypothetical protein